ncbi:MAG: RNA 3'-terminal phosphate cyclase [Thermodesulfobacteriota bacterium]|nr:MAG: RNA 3'-terminal phosphate cyclase [Thermodesulfobacteriota bacterium]
MDGSYGEGGGQMVRSALALASLTGLAVKVYDIRAGRESPGLKPQHLLSARAAANVTGGVLKGAEPGSMTLEYLPGRLKPGRYSFDVGTAGSTGLVFQAVLPALLFAGGPSSVSIGGGTHVPWSPVPEYIEEVFLGAVRPMGLEVSLGMRLRGYYPAGGGLIEADISPVEKPLSRISIRERGRLKGLKIFSAVSNLPLTIAERQLKEALSALQDFSGLIEARALDVSSGGRGTYVFVLAEFENVNAGFTSLGGRGKRAETVGSDAAESFLHYVKRRGALDRHLPDQLILFAALAGGTSFFTASEITSHLLTNIHVIE